MKLGIGTYAYAWAIGVPGYPVATPMDAFSFARRAAERGAKLIQIADNLPLHVLTAQQRAQLLAETQALGLDVEVGIRGIQPDNARAYLSIAQQFGSPVVRAVIDAPGYHPAIPEIIQTLRALMPEFESAGIILALENHDRLDAVQFAEIIEGVASDHVGICLDTVNSFGALEGPQTVLDTLGPQVVNLHIKDFSIRRADHNMGFIIEGAPAGQGRLNIPWLLDQLRGYRREFNAILELWPAPEATVEETVRKEDAWVIESMTYLRNLNCWSDRI